MESAPPSNEHDIFISYSWHYRKEFADRLYSFLTESKLKVWKDDQGGMSGNMFDDMKRGIDSAEWVLFQ